MTLRHLYHRIMGHIRPFDTKDAVLTVTWRDNSIYPFLMPGIRKFLESNGCRYQNNFPNALCCFAANKIEIDREGILALASKDYYKSITNYLCYLIKQVKYT